MTARPELSAPLPAEAAPRTRPLWLRVLLHLVFLGIGIGCFLGWQHLRLQGDSPAAMACLIAAGLLLLAPIRLVLSALLSIERRAMHLVHLVAGLGFVGLAASGGLPGHGALGQGALAPFTLMGAAQALMHAQHPRNARQAEALRHFVAGLQQLQGFGASTHAASPESVARSAAVLHDLIGRAQALGQTELDSDPGFQSALSRVSTRVGVGLGLDGVDAAIEKLAEQPGGAHAASELRTQLAHARHTLGRAHSAE